MLFKFKDFLPKGRGNIPPAFVFHGVDGENHQVIDSPSWYNAHEISQVFYYVNELYRAGCTAEDIGIITPYSKQVFITSYTGIFLSYNLVVLAVLSLTMRILICFL